MDSIDNNSIDNNSISFYDIRVILIIIVVIIFIFIFINGNVGGNRGNNRGCNLVENMAPGIIDQMYAQDAQDTYLKGNVDQLATGNYLLNWNQPTRLATGSYYYSTGPNRGTLLKNLCHKCNNKECNCKDGPVYYPNAYTGDYFEFPTPDINYPLPYIVSNGAFVKEGFENSQTSNAKLILFYADWCGHCKKFKPIFDGELKQKISNLPVKLETIDSDKNREITSKYNVSAFPTLILEVNNKVIKYDGERKSENIIQFIKKHLNL